MVKIVTIPRQMRKTRTEEYLNRKNTIHITFLKIVFCFSFVTVKPQYPHRCKQRKRHLRLSSEMAFLFVSERNLDGKAEAEEVGVRLSSVWWR